MNNPWIQTFTGRKFYPLHPRAEDVCLEDIAHALSMKCRFTGHCRTFYSVAEHCVRIAERAERQFPKIAWLAPLALLHDAAEAYLPDVASPIKDRVWLDRCKVSRCSFKWFEDDVMIAVREALFPTHIPHKPDPFSFERCQEVIDNLDLRMLATEARDLMNIPEPWNLPLPPFSEPLGDTLTPAEAELRFFVLAGRYGIRETSIAAG